MKHKRWVIALILTLSMSLPSLIFAAFTVQSFSFESSQISLVSGGTKYVVLASSFPQTLVNDIIVEGDIYETVDELLEVLEEASGPARIDSEFPALVYPNPFRLTDGALLGYYLDGKVDSIDVYVYNSRGQLMVQKKYDTTQTGAVSRTYNTIPIDYNFFGYNSVSAGVYFIYVVHDGKILSKTKMGVLP